MYTQLVHIKLVFLVTHMVLFAFSLFLLFSLLQQLPFILLLVVALVFGLENARYATITKQLRVGYTFLCSFSLILFHLFPKSVFDYRFYVLFFELFLSLPLCLSHLFSQASFLYEFDIHFFLLHLSLMLNLVVILVYFFILAVQLTLFRLKIVILHFFVHFLDLLIFQLALLLLFLFLSQLHVQSIHHFFTKDLTFLFMLLFRLQSNL